MKGLYLRRGHGHGHGFGGEGVGRACCLWVYCERPDQFVFSCPHAPKRPPVVPHLGPLVGSGGRGTGGILRARTESLGAGLNAWVSRQRAGPWHTRTREDWEARPQMASPQTGWAVFPRSGPYGTCI